VSCNAISKLAFAKIVPDKLPITNSNIKLQAKSTGTPNTILPPYIVAI